MISFIKKYKFALIAAFLIPAVLLGLAYALEGIYWGSGTSVLAGDAYHQYVAVLSMYGNILHHPDQLGFLYTFTSGLGLNLYAFSAYYMGSFFMPITAFFNVQNMPDALYLITLLKFGAIGLSAFIALRNLYQKPRTLVIIAFSTAYALMSFLTSQVEITMWQDVFILLPLIIWGLHSLQDAGRRRLYFISLTILFIQNYYFGFMVAIFVLLYFLARSTFRKWSWRSFLDFAVTSGLAGLTSLIMLLPMYLDLRANNSQALSSTTALLTENSKLLDLFAKNFVGSYDTTQYQAVPMIYIGLIPLSFALLFFLNKGIRLRTKLAFAGLFAILIASFYLQKLDLFWQGMHSPNMFLHRYAFLFSILVLILAMETLELWHKVKLWQIFTVFIFLIAGFSLTYFSNDYGYLKLSLLAISLLFLLAYLALLVAYRKGWIMAKVFVIILSIFMIAESGMNSFYQLDGIQNEWHFASRSYYDSQAKTLAPIVKKIQERQGSLFARTENTTPDTANDGMKYGFNGISQFSSVRNSNASRVMGQLGFHTDSTYLNLRYTGNSLLMDSLFNVAYNINQSQPEKYGFRMLGESLYFNQEVAGLGIFVPGAFQDVKLTKDDELANQTKLVNALAKDSLTYFKQVYTTSEQTDNKITSHPSGLLSLTGKTPGNTDLSVTYGITAPANSQLYLKVPNISYGNESASSTRITVSEDQGKSISPIATYSVASNDSGDLFNLGTYPKDTPLKVTLAFPDNPSVNFDRTSFWAMDTKAYSQAISKLRQTPVVSQTVKNGIEMGLTPKSSGQVFISLPYDKGWSAKLDGKAVKIEKAQDGFMKVDLPAGQHELKLSFFPQGLKIGIVSFILGILFFIGYDFCLSKKRRDRKNL
ncbi:YfhO family protein [Lactococcus termiticola]|uniref:Bacterial membrane protein YfhO n=1 Tax=Lactococcus termiticola TaxID=2169526 RepID=A0A2R5HHP0_9LACT|nr:YfhO family protein [Lactococcus termiticola]GBG97376.1 bacterial membrane protein YfhO [Lactococcus termiticola]